MNFLQDSLEGFPARHPDAAVFERAAAERLVLPIGGTAVAGWRAKAG